MYVYKYMYVVQTCKCTNLKLLHMGYTYEYCLPSRMRMVMGNLLTQNLYIVTHTNLYNLQPQRSTINIVIDRVEAKNITLVLLLGKVKYCIIKTVNLKQLNVIWVNTNGSLYYRSGRICQLITNQFFLSYFRSFDFLTYEFSRFIWFWEKKKKLILSKYDF